MTMTTQTPTKNNRVFYVWYFRRGKTKGPFVVIASSSDEAKKWADAGNGALAVETNCKPTKENK